MNVGIILISIVTIALFVVIWLYLNKCSITNKHIPINQNASFDEPVKELKPESLIADPLPLEKKQLEEELPQVEQLTEDPLQVESAMNKPVIKNVTKDTPKNNEPVKKVRVKKVATKPVAVETELPTKNPVKKKATKTATITEKPVLKKASQAKSPQQRLKDEIVNSYMNLHASGSKGGVRALMNAGIGQLKEDAEVMEVLDEIERQAGKNVLGDDAYTTIYEYGFVKFFSQIDVKMLTELGLEEAIAQLKEDAS